MSGLPIGLALAVLSPTVYLTLALIVLLEHGHLLSPMALAWSHTGFRKVMRQHLAKYVGVYKGVWARQPRVVEVTLSGDTLFVSVAGGEPQRLAPQSETYFSGTGLGYNFIRDDHGIATDVMEIHVSGDYKLQRQK